jgi:CubicO group peptidase (beta-lactamase class C family)
VTPAGTSRPVAVFNAAAYVDRLAELASRYDVPGASLAVSAGDQDSAAAVGVLNRRTGVTADPTSLFQIGSITKPWTAALVLSLVEDGRLSLDDLVRDHVPALHLADGAADAVTVRQLLNHTSGLPGDWFPDTGRGDDCLAKLVVLLADAPLTHQVGAFASYSNAAFSLAGHVAEQVLDTTWDEALRERVLAPLGLQHTVTLAEDALLHRAAVGHLGLGAEQRVAPVWQLPRACGPAGLICATASDTVAFGRAFLRDAAGPFPACLVEVMTTRTAAFPTAGAGSGSFGLGWGLGEWSGQRVMAHDGGTIGQSAALRVFPDAGLVIALLTNGGQWTPFRDEVLRDVLGQVRGPQPPAPPTPPAEPASYHAVDVVGHYSRPGVELDVIASGSDLTLKYSYTDELEQLAAGDEPPQRLVCVADDQFLLAPVKDEPWSRVHFLRTTSGDVDYLHAAGRAARRTRAIASGRAVTSHHRASAWPPVARVGSSLAHAVGHGAGQHHQAAAGVARDDLHVVTAVANPSTFAVGKPASSRTRGDTESEIGCVCQGRWSNGEQQLRLGRPCRGRRLRSGLQFHCG